MMIPTPVSSMGQLHFVSTRMKTLFPFLTLKLDQNYISEFVHNLPAATAVLIHLSDLPKAVVSTDKKLPLVSLEIDSTQVEAYEDKKVRTFGAPNSDKKYIAIPADKLPQLCLQHKEWVIRKYYAQFPTAPWENVKSFSSS